ncbi:EamA family transporter [Marinisporobacter balticus]|uniref:O-acetylserine/cysteine efflux transporter n=1 Tax=Marinisporobacter balticus TaxID=2018667 RepID=A0A4R2KP89_9FIRM|nr:EamA family transporter [Marinisporobacter balticus]TCO74427.1 O-acetylserine/cysteine efflux transporter [Marinisporobacter balticus]
MTINEKMSKKDFVLALLVVTVWGANFTIIKLGLAGVPSMLLAVLRYVFTAFPAVLFIKRPALEWQYCVAYGFAVGVGQFACLFYAMSIGMPAGIASVVLQSQALFTILFASIFLKEGLKRKQVIGLVVALLGLYLIGGNTGSSGLFSIPFGAFLLTLLAAAFWSFSNIVVKQAANRTASRGEKLDMLSLIVWSSLVPPIPLMILALMFDTPQTLLHAISNMNGLSIFAVFYLAFFATLFGYGTWGGLLAKHSAGRVAPLSLLVPVTGLFTAQIVLGEQLSVNQWIGGLVVILGIMISNFGHVPIQLILKAKGE